jgi:transcription elongation factor GreA
MAQAVGELPIIGKLKKELEELKHELRTKLPKEIEAARAHGDLKENAEYHAAKERQGILNARIGQIAGRIRELSLYNLASIPHGVVAYGSKVTLEDLDSGESVTYEIVFPEEADANAGTISLSAPLGRALVGKAEGDEVEVQAPRGKRSYAIVKLETMHDRTPAERPQG